ncbi:Uncharacterised protein [Vibrio cholerae]|nr:Uncharacterised protein [Vibrio cholerae]
MERLSDGVPKHPWKALCTKLLCSALTKAELPESVATKMKTLVTVFAVK